MPVVMKHDAIREVMKNLGVKYRADGVAEPGQTMQLEHDEAEHALQRVYEIGFTNGALARIASERNGRKEREDTGNAETSAG